VVSNRSPRVPHFTLPGPHTNICMSGSHKNRRKSPKIRASGRPPRSLILYTTDRKIKLRRPQGHPRPGVRASVRGVHTHVRPQRGVGRYISPQRCSSRFAPRAAGSASAAPAPAPPRWPCPGAAGRSAPPLLPPAACRPAARSAQGCALRGSRGVPQQDPLAPRRGPLLDPLQRGKVHR
jgi:hypothetical protein